MLIFPVVMISLLIAEIIFLILDWTGIIDKLELKILRHFCYYVKNENKDENTSVPEDKEGR